MNSSDEVISARGIDFDLATLTLAFVNLITLGDTTARFSLKHQETCSHSVMFLFWRSIHAFQGPTFVFWPFWVVNLQVFEM